MMKLTPEDAIWAADQFIAYFQDIDQIENYFRSVKMDRVNNITPTLFDEKLEDAFFSDFSMSPEDMDFQIIPVGPGGLDNDYFSELLGVVASHVIEDSIPGRELKWVVMEKNTGKFVGFIRFGSPTINSKPRNIYLGGAPDLEIFNRHACMGFIIVPTQPFGFNYLGGKLLALMCASHFAREAVSSRFQKEICWFETTSLYGTAKGVSQYDGLKPFLRHIGDTVSDFTPLMHDTEFHRMHKYFIVRNNNKKLTLDTASSKKLKRQNRMVSIIKNSLEDTEKLKTFTQVMDRAKTLTQQKRFYICDYGYSNVREILAGKETVPVPGPRYDDYHLDNLIAIWKTKATKRYNKLVSEGRLRTEPEIWTNGADIDIIR